MLSKTASQRIHTLSSTATFSTVPRTKTVEERQKVSRHIFDGRRLLNHWNIESSSPEKSFWLLRFSEKSRSGGDSMTRRGARVDAWNASRNADGMGKGLRGSSVHALKVLRFEWWGCASPKSTRHDETFPCQVMLRVTQHPHTFPWNILGLWQNSPRFILFLPSPMIIDTKHNSRYSQIAFVFRLIPIPFPYPKQLKIPHESSASCRQINPYCFITPENSLHVTSNAVSLGPAKLFNRCH